MTCPTYSTCVQDQQNPAGPMNTQDNEPIKQVHSRPARYLPQPQGSFSPFHKQTHPKLVTAKPYSFQSP